MVVSKTEAIKTRSASVTEPKGSSYFKPEWLTPQTATQEGPAKCERRGASEV